LKVSLIINPIAGNRAFRSINLIESLLRDRVSSLTTHITSYRGDAFSFAQRRHNDDLIMVAGGDGTFNEVVNGLVSGGNDIPLAFLPLGTTNVLAKELGIPEDVEEAIALGLTGTPKRISLGRIVITPYSSPITRYFCLMAGIGFDGTAVSRVRDNIVKKISGKGAYVLAGLKTWLSYSLPPIRVETPDGRFEGHTAIIGKASCYGGYYKVTPDASLTEPVLDICLFKGGSRMDLLRYVYGIFRRRHLNYQDVLYRKYSEVEVTSTTPVHIQVDGDYFGTTPAFIDVVPDAIRLIW